MYAIVKTGGKQYRVEQGQSLLVERLPVAEGESISLAPLLYVDGSKVVDQVDGLSGVAVEARVTGHERGPKLRVVKFKPKRGYKRRTGHRQELTRIEVTSVKLTGGSRRKTSSAAGEQPKPVEAEARPRVTPKPRGGPSPGSAASSKRKEKAVAAPEAASKSRSTGDGEGTAPTEGATPRRSRSAPKPATKPSSRSKQKEDGDGT